MLPPVHSSTDPDELRWAMRAGGIACAVLSVIELANRCRWGDFIFVLQVGLVLASTLMVFLTLLRLPWPFGRALSSTIRYALVLALGTACGWLVGLGLHAVKIFPACEGLATVVK